MRLVPIPGSGGEGGDVDIGIGGSQIPTNTLIQSQYPIVSKAIGTLGENVPTVDTVTSLISSSVSDVAAEVDTIVETVNNIQQAIEDLETTPAEMRTLGKAFAAESLEEGMYIHAYRDGTTTRCLRANAATGLLSNGYVETAAAVSAEVVYYLNGFNSKANDLPGGKIYLSATTPGRASSTPPAQRSTYWLQELGESIGVNKHQFQPGFSLQLL